MNLLSKLMTAVVFAGVAYAQPTIDTGGITNAASYSAPELPNGALARGGMIVIKGNNLGPTPLQIINSFPLPLSLAGTSIKATVGGTTVDLYMIYTSTRQLAAILPSQTPEGTGTLTVTYNGQASAATSIRVVRSAFGIFSLNQAGKRTGRVSECQQRHGSASEYADRRRAPRSASDHLGNRLGSGHRQ